MVNFTEAIALVLLGWILGQGANLLQFLIDKRWQYRHFIQKPQAIKPEDKPAVPSPSPSGATS